MELTISNVDLFVEYAAGDLDRWMRLIGWPIFHNTFGLGKMTKVESSKSGPMFLVHFNDLPPDQADKLFGLLALTHGFFNLETLPENLDGIEAAHLRIETRYWAAKAEAERLKRLEAERQIRLEAERRQREMEAESATEFLSLQRKYGISGYEKTTLASPLFQVLLKLEVGEYFTKDDFTWLENQHLYPLLAIYYERCYQEDGDLWNVAKAGKFWRMANKPNRVLTIQCDLASGDPRSRAAVLTNRGAALRDMGQLEEAQKLVKSALEQDKNSYYAYDLLGAICFQAGELERGEEYLAKALELGATPRSQEQAIKTAIQNSQENDRERTAQYLLAKDPEKYAWAKHYLKSRKNVTRE